MFSSSFEPPIGGERVRSSPPPPPHAARPRAAVRDVAFARPRCAQASHDDALASLLQRSVRQRGSRAAGALLQRVANVTGEFIGKTPEDDDVIDAIGEHVLVSKAFEVEAQFKPAREGTAEEQKQMINSGEYRQYVRGYFTSGDDTDDEPHQLVGENPGALDRVVWREDVLPSAIRRSGKKRYGYRSGPSGEAPQGYFHDRERKMPDRQFGPLFWGWDAPQGTARDSFMMLEFEGRLVDTKDNSRVLATRRWKVAGAKNS